MFADCAPYYVSHAAGETDAPKRPHTRHGHCAVLYKNEMVVLGGETDAQARGKDSNKGSTTWGHIIWKLNLETWQWHRVEPQVCSCYLFSPLSMLSVQAILFTFPRHLL